MVTHTTVSQSRNSLLLVTGLLILGAFLVLLHAVRPAAAANDDSLFIVRLNPDADPAAVAADHGATLLGSVSPLALHQMQGPAGLAASLSGDARVLSVHANYELEARPSWFDSQGDDVLEAQKRRFGFSGEMIGEFETQWAVGKLRLGEAHGLATGNSVTVAVLDTGVDATHPLLDGHVVGGYDFVDGDVDASEAMNGVDDDGDGIIDEAVGHGTHVSGIVLLTAPDANIMPLRIFNDDGDGDYFDAIAAIVYAADHGADVINLSGAGDENDPLLAEAIDYATGKGVVFVASAGINHLFYPASYANVIGVGSTDSADQLASFAMYGNQADVIYAPGVAIESAYFDGGTNNYAVWTGNSMAAPFVAGEAALMMSTGSCDNVCVRTLIAQTAHIIHPGGQTQHRTDAFDAVAAAMQYTAADIELTYANGASDQVNDNFVKPYINLVNHGITVPFEELTIRYWYSAESAADQVFTCDWVPLDCDHVTATFGTTNIPGATHYVDVGFTAGAGTLQGGTQMGQLEMRVNNADWSAYDENNDYSHLTQSSHGANSHIGLYRNGILIAGEAPAVTDLPEEPDPTPPPTTVAGTTPPTAPPTSEPTAAPTAAPTAEPTAAPTQAPTAAPTVAPTSPPPTATAQPTVAPTSAPTVSLALEAKSQDSMTDNHMTPNLRLTNTGSSPVALETVTLRYYYSGDSATQIVECDWVPVGCNNLVSAVVVQGGSVSSATHYIEIGFGSGAGELAVGASTEVKVRVHNSNWSDLNESDDYSRLNHSTFTSWDKVTVFSSGTLVWGIEP